VEVIRQLRCNGSPVIFIGDGLSDRFAARAADVVFAKRQLLSYCREHDIICQPFETFAEVETQIEAMMQSSIAEEAPKRRESSVRTRKLKVEVAV
jgi:2-hydroxy-3-keto-5-methylthiopentenyl-1-phosphate phosphatase